MDEALKARLIGAAVLVAVAVLLIPELLSGRKAVEQVAGEGGGAPGKRVITIELGGGPGHPAGSQASGDAQATAAPSSSTALPSAPSAQGATAVAPTGQSEVPAREPTATREPTRAAAAPAPAATSAAAAPPARAAPAPAQTPPRPTPAVSPAAGGWAVQVGAFGSVATANGMVKRLQADGFRAFVAPVRRDGKTLHRVRVGPEAEKAAAERLAGQLKARGLPATVVRND